MQIKNADINDITHAIELKTYYYELENAIHSSLEGYDLAHSQW